MEIMEKPRRLDKKMLWLSGMCKDLPNLADVAPPFLPLSCPIGNIISDAGSSKKSIVW